MKDYRELQKCPLFQEIASEDLPSLLNCLAGKEQRYSKGEYILLTGSTAGQVGILLSGEAHVLQEDFWGNRSILMHVAAGGLFAEAFACAEVDELPISVLATADCHVLFIDYNKVITTCPSVCTFHARLIRNMLMIMAEKNVGLTEKLAQICKRNMREKLQAYLSQQAYQAGSREFAIPFSRQELADYLNLDRSALSRELSQMRQEGLLSYHKNSFCLTIPKELV